MGGDRKKIGLFIIISGIIIIGLIIYFLLIQNKSNLFTKEKTPEVDIETVVVEPIIVNPNEEPINYQQYDLSKEVPRETNGDDLGMLAKSFATRFGSFSNQSNYGNFTDLKILMTDSMKRWVDTYVADLRDQPKNIDNAYYGITTDAINYEIIKFDDRAGKAEIVITTQRRESADKINGGESYNQDLRLELVKVNDEWLFNAAYWSK